MQQICSLSLKLGTLAIFSMEMLGNNIPICSEPDNPLNNLFPTSHSTIYNMVESMNDSKCFLKIQYL